MSSEPVVVFPKTRPQTPPPWSWQCHHCGQVYLFAFTNRCLQCSHFACNPSRPSATTTVTGSRKRKRRPGHCKSEFDYESWQVFGQWRRERDEFLLVTATSGCVEQHDDEEEEQQQPEVAAKRKRLQDKASARRDERRLARFVRATHHCERDCDYPSQCHHERWEYQQHHQKQKQEAFRRAETTAEAARKRFMVTRAVAATKKQQQVDDEGEEEEEYEESDEEEEEEDDEEEEDQEEEEEDDDDDNEDDNGTISQTSPTSPPESPPSSPESEPFELEACLVADNKMMASQEQEEHHEPQDRQEELEQIAELLRAAE